MGKCSNKKVSLRDLHIRLDMYIFIAYLTIYTIFLQAISNTNICCRHYMEFEVTNSQWSKSTRELKSMFFFVFLFCPLSETTVNVDA